LYRQKNKAGLDIAHDTVIIEVADYFEKRQEYEKMVMALLYAGRAINENSKKMFFLHQINFFYYFCKIKKLHL
jgi:hypothetical protein